VSGLKSMTDWNDPVRTPPIRSKRLSNGHAKWRAGGFRNGLGNRILRTNGPINKGQAIDLPLYSSTKES
jgi:hypothetical protein